MVATVLSESAPKRPAAAFARVSADGGVALAVERFGDADAPSLVFAHGFGQTRRAWTGTARTLAEEGWHCLTADSRGHGDSGWNADGDYDFPQFVDDLVLLARHAAQPTTLTAPILVGASMGGLLGLVAQAMHAPFRALVLVDITPRWETAGVERILAFMRAHPDGFGSVEEAADAIAHYLPHRRERKSPERLRQLLVAHADGRLRWHWDPRMLDRIAADSERQQSHLLDAARNVRVPTLLISGSRSDIVSDSTIDEFLACVPHAEHVRVEHATHMVVGDRNDAFTDAVRQFIEPLRPSGTKRSTS
ncbi:MAG TPA: alpha/beta hydrolase [Rudaea sp.]|nr:alpha/beta hydrolase [Rudaea sp.]